MDTEKKHTKHTISKESLIIQADSKVTELTTDKFSIKKTEKNWKYCYNKSITITEFNAVDESQNGYYETVDNTDNLISFPRIHGEEE